MRHTILLALALSLAQDPGRSPAPRGTGFLLGRVVDADSGRPVAGAIVTVTGPVLPPRILTGADGYFLFRDLSRGSYSIAATKSGYTAGRSGQRRPGGPAPAIVLDEGQRLGDLVVRMWRFGVITGTVSDETGEALVSIQVRALRRSTSGGRTRYVVAGTATTDDRGIYRIASLVPGEYVTCVTAKQVETPSEDTRVAVYPTTFHPAALSATQAQPIVVTSGSERAGVDLRLNTLAAFRVSGIVAGPDGPASGVTVQMLADTLEDAELQADAPAALTDANGAFVFHRVPEGAYVLRAAIAAQSVPGRRGGLGYWTEMPISVAREDVADLAIVLQPALRISGRLEFAGGATGSANRIRQVPIVVEPASGSATAPSQPPARPDAEGEFVVEGLAPGKYIVRVTGSPEGWMFERAMYNGRDVSDSPLVVSNADVDGVVLTFTNKWTGLRGTVRSARGLPDADATVLVFPVDQQLWTDFGPTPRRLRSAPASISGEYSMTSLPPGDYYVIAVSEAAAGDWRDASFLSSLAQAATRLTILDGDQKTVDLRTQAVR